MKWWKQYLIGIFSMCAMVIYVQSELPVISVSSTYQRMIQLFYVDENMDVCMEEQPFICANTMDCLIKSIPSLKVLEGIVVEDMVLEEGNLVLRMSSTISLSKEKEALYMYLLQFSDVDRVKVYVKDELWDSGLYYDSKKVISNHFELFTSDLYMSMPLVMFENSNDVFYVKTVRIPYVEDYEIAKWLLYIYEEYEASIAECHVVDGSMVVSVHGRLKNIDNLQSMGMSLLLLNGVNEIYILHEQIEVFHKVY